MKVSIDGILGSAVQIKNQRQVDEDSLGKRKKEVRTDSVEIETRVNSRLDLIQKELKEIQTSLTKNQIIKDGIGQLRDDMGRGGENRARIMEDVRYDDRKVLHEFMGDTVSGKILGAKEERVNGLILQDVSNVKRLQVEVENIMASDLAGPGTTDGIIKNIESAFAKTNLKSLESISSLRADAVMRLIK